MYSPACRNICLFSYPETAAISFSRWIALYAAVVSWLQAFWWPAFAVFHVQVITGDGGGLLQVVPASPGDNQAAVGTTFAAGVADPALLGYIQATTQAPDIGFEEVCAFVFGGNGDVANCFACIFTALQDPSVFPLDPAPFAPRRDGCAIGRRRYAGRAMCQPR